MGGRGIWKEQRGEEGVGWGELEAWGMTGPHIGSVWTNDDADVNPMSP